jgi:hypothetical protein
MAYQNFVLSVGFAAEVRPADFTLADVQTLLPHIAGAGAAPPQNVCNLVRDMCAIAIAIADRIDRTRATAHIAAMLRDEVLSAGFSACPASKERDKWVIPADVGNALVAFISSGPKVHAPASPAGFWNSAFKLPYL